MDCIYPCVFKQEFEGWLENFSLELKKLVRTKGLKKLSSLLQDFLWRGLFKACGSQFVVFVL